MPNNYQPKYNTANLFPFKSAWNSGKTRTIRVPLALAARILAYAHALDSGEVVQDSSRDAMATILSKVESKAPGYRANSASQLIKDLKAVLSMSDLLG